MTNLKHQVQDCIHPQCPTAFASAIFEFSSWVRAHHTYCFGNANSIFIGIHNIAEEFSSYLDSTANWHGIEKIRHLDISTLGKDRIFAERRKVVSLEEARLELEHPPKSLFNLPESSQFDLIKHAIIDAEAHVVLALRLSFEAHDYRLDGHAEYAALLRTTIRLLHFIRTKAPKEALFTMSSDGDEARVKLRPHQESVCFCKLCWRKAKSNPSDNRNIPPKYCRIHNQKRAEIAKMHFGIQSGAVSKYRTALRKESCFTEALYEIQLLVLNEGLVLPRAGTVLSQIMRMRNLAYYIAKHAPH